MAAATAPRVDVESLDAAELRAEVTRLRKANDTLFLQLDTARLLLKDADCYKRAIEGIRRREERELIRTHHRADRYQMLARHAYDLLRTHTPLLLRAPDDRPSATVPCASEGDE
jgi:hypothetical protein